LPNTGSGITDSAIEKWEKNQNRPMESYRVRIVEFLEFDPVADKILSRNERAFKVTVRGKPASGAEASKAGSDRPGLIFDPKASNRRRNSRVSHIDG